MESEPQIKIATGAREGEKQGKEKRESETEKDSEIYTETKKY